MEIPGVRCSFSRELFSQVVTACCSAPASALPSKSRPQHVSSFLPPLSFPASRACVCLVGSAAHKVRELQGHGPQHEGDRGAVQEPDQFCGGGRHRREELRLGECLFFASCVLYRRFYVTARRHTYGCSSPFFFFLIHTLSRRAYIVAECVGAGAALPRALRRCSATGQFDVSRVLFRFIYAVFMPHLPALLQKA